jgi:phenylacetate-CoA ligase
MGEIVTKSREELHDRQDERLHRNVKWAYNNVAFYRDAFDNAGVEPADIDGTDDINKLPFTTKTDFQEQYPTGLFAVDRSEVVRVHASSGTTSKPKIVGYTEDDLTVWSEVMARSLSAAGLDRNDTLQNAYGLGLFTGGFGFHHGATELGMCVIPAGSGQTRQQIELMVDVESDAICLTPSYALYIAETAEEMGYDAADLPLSTVLYGAEPCTEPMRQEIEERLGATAYENYGLSELIGPGVAAECEAQNGLHVWEDHFYPEVIDPDTGDPVDPGTEGELVLTSLTKEALPVVRYRTGDMTTLVEESCDCGRPHHRMTGITGRTDDLIIVRGVNLYPSEIESVVLEIEGTEPQYRIDLYRENNLDRIDLTVEMTEDYHGSVSDLRDHLERCLSDVLSFTPDDLELVEYGSIERTEVGKVKRVYDHR